MISTRHIASRSLRGDGVDATSRVHATRAGPGGAAAREHAADATSTRIDPAGQSFTWLRDDDVDEQRVRTPRPFLTFNFVKMASPPSSDEVGGLFFDFEPFRTASVISSRRGREIVARHAVDAVATMASSRDHSDAVAAIASARLRRRDAVPHPSRTQAPRSRKRT